MPTTIEPSNGKLLIIIPGLTGHTQDNYVVSTAAALMPNYSQVCVYQYALVSEAQKCGRVDIMENLKFVINDVSTKYPIIHCVGFSYGANQLLYYVGSEGVNSKVQRAVVVSNPFSITKCSEMLSSFENWALTRILKASIGRISNSFVGYDISWKQVNKSRNMKEFDREFTTKVFGFKSVEQYHAEISSAQFVDSVTVPTLAISSRDDTVSKFEAITFSDRITYLITNLGGHNSFMDWRMRFWFLEPLNEYLSCS